MPATAAVRETENAAPNAIANQLKAVVERIERL